MATPLISILIFVFLAFSAFFSASETALFSIPRERILFFQSNRHKTYQWVFLLLEDGQRTLLLILLGNIFVNITLAGLIHSLLTSTLPDQSPIITLLVATLTIVIFGEMLPKNIAIKNNESIALLISPFLYHLKVLLSPVLKFIQKINQFFLIRIKERLRRPSPFITAEELKTGVIQSARDGAISSDEQDIILGILNQGSQPVRKMMVHRSGLLILPENSNVKTALKNLHDSGQFCAIVRESNDSGQIKGTVHLDRLLKADPGNEIASLVKSPVWVPETMEMADLISFLFNEGIEEACVLDEFGAFSGVFFLSNGLSQIITHAFSRSIIPRAEGKTMVFPGIQDIQTLNAWLPPSLLSFNCDARTLNGLITKYLGRIPVTGERFAIDEWNFYIILSSPTKIESILIRKRNGYDS